MKSDKTAPETPAAEAETKAAQQAKAEPQTTTRQTLDRHPKDRKAWKKSRAIALGLAGPDDDIVIS